MIGFRIDVTAAMSVAVSTAVVIAFARECFGRSRAAMAAAALLLAANIALACSASPIVFVALWQFEWFLAWSLSLFFSDEDVQAWFGRLLMAGWLFDGVLIAGAVILTNRGFPDGAPEPLALLTWGSALSLASRIAALPVGAHAALNDRPVRPAAAWILITVLPPATIVLLKLIDLLTIDSTPRLAAGQLMIAAAISAALASFRQESAVRETAWRISAGLAGAAAVAVLIPAWPGRIVWLVAAMLCVVIGRRLPETIIAHQQAAPPVDLVGRLEAAAAREWNLPRVWRFGVAMPVRGASQILRFVDGFAFEQLPVQGFRRLEAATAPVRRALPELFSRLLVAIALMAAFIVLLALAFR